MSQNQTSQPVKGNQSGQQNRMGQSSNQNGQWQESNPGNIHPPSVDDKSGDNDDVSEIPGEHHDKEGQPDYKIPTAEQRSRDAAPFEHTSSEEKSWRDRIQSPTTEKGGGY